MCGRNSLYHETIAAASCRNASRIEGTHASRKKPSYLSVFYEPLDGSQTAVLTDRTEPHVDALRLAQSLKPSQSNWPPRSQIMGFGAVPGGVALAIVSGNVCHWLRQCFRRLTRGTGVETVDDEVEHAGCTGRASGTPCQF